MWLPPGAVAVWLGAVGCVAAACTAARRGRWNVSVICVLVGALLIRAYAAADRTLHPWDERYHALVAKRLVTTPLTPTLYDDPVLPFDYRDWTSNHVWLHKPPLALWLQAASMRTFGVNEVAMRTPSVAGSTLAVGATFAIGTLLFTPSVGLVASVLHAFNGFHVDLAAGRRASDHVDTLLLFVFSAGLASGLAANTRRFSWVLVGVATGAAYMTKALAGLMLLPVWAAYRLMATNGVRAAAKDLPAAGLVAALVILPWTMYTQRRFPIESTHEREYAFRHISERLEEQGGPFWQYLYEMPRIYGELVLVPLAWAAGTWIARRAPPARRTVLLWAGIPYLLFSLFATKMPAYVITAAPAMFLLQAEFLLMLKRCSEAGASTLQRVAAVAALVVFALLPARYLLEPNGPLEYRDRDPQWTRDLRALNQQIGARKAVVFNAPRPIEGMFYTPYVFYDRVPGQADVDALISRGYAVFIYDDGSRPVPAVLPRDVTVVRSSR